MTGSTRRPAQALGVYLVLAFGMSWLIALPLWLSGDGLQHPAFGTIALCMMLTPAIAALVTVFVVECPEHPAERLGLVPLRPAGRFLAYLGLGLAVPVTLVFGAFVAGSLLGVYPADFTRFSGFREMLMAQTGGRLPLPVGVLVALQFVNVVLGSILNLLPALGEELGWRGWLLPHLQRFGTVPALLVSGIIWGLWHAPLLLLGYNYPTAPGWLSVLMMIGMCTLVGSVFAWLRIRSRSVWPAALAHAALNASVGLSMVYVQSGSTFDTVHATILGWSGWILPAVLLALLIVTKQFAWPPKAPVRRRNFF
ncbi:CPBP family intramembrane glutamic endopeptidase [Paramicrobacterium agarici]|uniref:CAAX prenyl protease-like protein n=1 Tax=Paramicrobacterium agarici TaxID=630514 RepID=A0A2A9DSQ3_9MICO|nr:CPBP family intramembrane glutamic endopeptidase [Microbacterium agarici]PFG29185.1 CAAX prenyl protease-like protein [Microbacterium agarici]